MSITLPSIPNPEAPLPPLPDAIPDAEPTHQMMPQSSDAGASVTPNSMGNFPWWNMRSLRHGCYLLRYTPNTGMPFVHYDGTMRIQRDGTNTIASGDLYLHYAWRPFPTFPQVSEPNPANGIPIFPRAKYRYYLKVTKILEWVTLGNSFTLEFDRWRFKQSTNTWTFDEKYTAIMTWTTAPTGYPSSSDYLTGDVKNTSGAVVGNLTMGWVSKYLRKATIEADRVKDSEYPADNGNGVDWQDVYDKVDWDVKVYDSDEDLVEPSGDSWSDAELHRAMLARRDSGNLDEEWRYHLLCVKRLDSTSRGIMYDAYGGDSNNIPREGAAISSHWDIPDTTMWGQVKGTRFGAAPAPYFRTAVHELGHAMGLYHNTTDFGFMNTTGVIAAKATPGTFPDNVQWAFAPDDAKRLRHMPDPWVRPGMIPFGQPYNAAPISPTDMILDAEGLQLNVTPLIETVPIGAPVRVDIELVNTSDFPLPVPESLSLKTGHTKGKVIDPSSTVRTFWPLVRCIEEHELKTLQPGERMSRSLTLLRGYDGFLFPSPGTYRVIVEVSWDVDGFEMGVAGSTNIMVTPPVDDAHSAAALKVCNSPDALLTLAIGGDHLDEGVEAIQAAMENPVLRPHYAIVEAKRIGNRFGKRAAKVKEALSLLENDTVMSSSEIKRAAELVQKTTKADRAKGAVKNTITMLKKKADNISAEEAVVEMVEKL